MDWYKMAVFLYAAAPTHFLSDFLNHWMEKKGFLLILHCFLYAIFFIPVFWWLKINFLWLIFVFGSHLLIDSQLRTLGWIVKKILARARAQPTTLESITLKMDQVLHLLVPLIIALFTF